MNNHLIQLIFISQYGFTALILAAESGYVDVVTALLAAGSDKNQQTDVIPTASIHF